MVIKSNFLGSYDGKNVLITGHTGFKGSWLSIWLNELGANVTGYSLDPPTKENNFEASKLGKRIADLRGDVRDFNRLREVVRERNPDYVFHLAAQPIVIKAYREPRETLETNVMGVINLLEALRLEKKGGVFVGITSDKCYKNKGETGGYREGDELGGKEPYGMSKSIAEMVIESYRESYFNPKNHEEHGMAVASARAGNVIGGGDFAEFRLVPDAMRALMKNEKIILRNPDNTRPWQHVLEPLSGYLWLAAKMTTEKKFAEPWNFGPRIEDSVSCRNLVEKMIHLWGKGKWEASSGPKLAKEDANLRLNCDKSMTYLGWKPNYDIDKSLTATVEWFIEYKKQMPEKREMYKFNAGQIESYTAIANKKGLVWAK